MTADTGFVIWFTGLSGSGKSTLTRLVAAELRRRGVHVEALDGDDVRKMLSKGLGFSKEDRDANIRRIGYVARMIARTGACGIAAAISPYRDIRDEVRRATDRFCEVYCECPLEVLAERDPKGLYKRAMAGEIKHFTGVDDPYEAPENPEVHCRTDLEAPEDSAAKIVAKLEELGYAPKAGALARQSKALPLPHGSELVERRLRGASATAARERAKGLPSVQLGPNDVVSLEAIAVGAYSPLAGFMTRKDYRKVVKERRLENGLVWPSPVTLGVDSETAQRASEAGAVTLQAAGGQPAAILSVADCYEIDRAFETEHLGAAEGDGPTHYLGGEVEVFDLDVAEDDPATVRRMLTDRGWSQVAAFQAFAPMLLAEEYQARCALELSDGLLIQTIAGPDSGGSSAPAARWHRHLIEAYFRPERTAHVTARLVRGKDPERAALLAALVAKNYGAAYLVVPFDPAAGAAGVRPIFDYHSRAELGILPLCFSDVFHSTRLGSMASTKTAPGDVSDRIALTAEVIRRGLETGDALPPELVRPEMASVLAQGD